MFSSRQCGARLASIGSEWRMNEKSSAGVEKVLEKTSWRWGKIALFQAFLASFEGSWLVGDGGSIHFSIHSRASLSAHAI